MSSIIFKTTLLQKQLMAASSRQIMLQRPATAASGYQRCYLSSRNDTESQPQTMAAEADDRVFPVYMHHVSKIVLQHLQDSRAGWLIEQGLDSGLQIKSNGTFLLHFPATQDGSAGGKIW